MNADATSEPNETFTVNLSAPSNATIADAQAIGTIASNVAQPLLTVSDATIVEGTKSKDQVEVTVSLSQPSAEDVLFVLRTSNGTAVAPDDYASRKEELTIRAGDTAKRIFIDVFGDETDEPDETFKVDLSNALHAIVTDGIGVVTITDDDKEPALSIGDVIVMEGQYENPQALVPVTLTGETAKLVKVNFTADDETADGEDYRVSPGTLFFEPGDTTQWIAVDIHADRVEEPNEIFTLSLGKPSNASILDDLAVVTIANDDFSVHTLEVKKLGGGSGTVKGDPEGISCGDDCAHTYETGAKVTLYQRADEGSIFTGWSGGGCSGTGECTVALDEDVKVEATFETDTRQLTVGLAGTGSGIVVSTPDGIDCGEDCDEDFPAGRRSS